MDCLPVICMLNLSSENCLAIPVAGIFLPPSHLPLIHWVGVCLWLSQSSQMYHLSFPNTWKVSVSHWTSLAILPKFKARSRKVDYEKFSMIIRFWRHFLTREEILQGNLPLISAEENIGNYNLKKMWKFISMFGLRNKSTFPWGIGNSVKFLKILRNHTFPTLKKKSHNCIG